MKAALARYDFGTVFRAIRAQAGLTQQQFGDLLGMTQGRISDIECGTRQLFDVRLVSRVATKCDIPAELLGFGAATVDEAGGIGLKGGSWMHRRDFVQHVAAITVGVVGAGLDIDRISALLDPDPTEDGVRRVGVEDVAALERITGQYEHVAHAYGGGYARDAAVAQLRATLPLLDAEVEPAVHERLHVAATHLALIAGWMSFDTGQHDYARRVWLAGLEITRRFGGLVSTDLTAHLLFVMAQQALFVQRPDEAQRLVLLGQTVAVGGHPVTPSTSTCLATNLAFAHAARGDTRGCEQALGTAEQEFTRIDPADTSPWACVDGEVKLTTWRGHALYEMGRATGNQTAVARALPALLTATDNQRAMSRAMYLPDLAGAHALTGDVDTAVAVGHQAVDIIAELRSMRARQRLRVLDTVLQPLGDAPGVAELRERTAATFAA